MRDQAGRPARPAKGLTHNPFARLRADGKPANPTGPERADGVERGAPPVERGKVVVRREKKGHGGKVVTVVEGEGLGGRDLEEMAREVARALGVGARVEGRALVVQGEQGERVERWMRERGIGGIVRGNWG